MRIAAYVLVADPTFLRQSVTAYYPLVDRVILCFDSTATSWTGTPIPVQQCLQILREIDVDGKFVELPGSFARPDHSPLDNDTRQRQFALDVASDAADWVLQLDTDEVIPRIEAFRDALHRADRSGAGALDYPSRWLYSRIGAGRYLERSSRFGRSIAGYPGPLAVRSGTRLRLARQTNARHYRVDIRQRSTDPWRPKTSRVDQTVAVSDAVLHFSWVRTRAVMERKLGWSGHADELGSDDLRAWLWRTSHPHVTALTSPFRRRDARFKIGRVPEPPGGPAETASD